MEIWKSLHFIGYPKYEVSNMGRVRSLNANNTGQTRILRFGHSGKYPKVVLCNERGCKDFRVNRLVAITFIPNPDNLPEVNHKNGDPGNNCADNLEWMTGEDNKLHAVNTGLTLKGERNGNAKLTDEQAQWIREHYIPRHPQYSQAALARKFNVSPYCIYSIVNNVWRKQ